MKILAVDDDPVFLDILGVALRNLGFQDLTLVLSGQEALDEMEVRGNSFDCFLLDIHMPEMDGVELCRRIRQMAEVLEGADFAEANKDFTRRTVAAESGNPEEFVEEIFGPDFNLGLAPSLDEEILTAFERQTAFLFRNGFLPREVPLAEWLTPEPLTHALLARAKIGG